MHDSWRQDGDRRALQECLELLVDLWIADHDITGTRMIQIMGQVVKASDEVVYGSRTWPMFRGDDAQGSAA